MNDLPLVSVIVLNYNAGELLLNCVKSLKNSTYKNLEIIIVDGNSTDGTRDIVSALGEENPQTLKQVVLENTVNGKKSIIETNGAFIAIGHDPATSLFKGKLKMDNENYIITKNDSTETSVKGIFAAGDVKDKIFRQAVTAAGMGCMAALEAEKHLSSK